MSPIRHSDPAEVLSCGFTALLPGHLRDENGRAYSPYTYNVEEMVPWRTLTGRQHFYLDHPGYIQFGEHLATFKPKPLRFSTEAGKTLMLNHPKEPSPGRNPRTGEAIAIAAKRDASFRPSKDRTGTLAHGESAPKLAEAV